MLLRVPFICRGGLRVIKSQIKLIAVVNSYINSLKCSQKELLLILREISHERGLKLIWMIYFPHIVIIIIYKGRNRQRFNWKIFKWLASTSGVWGSFFQLFSHSRDFWLNLMPSHHFCINREMSEILKKY